ncbi:MAG: hypothetical protein L0Y72_20815 [Gemmataceae bacterium]|nr:hypothetical protein [Gemmataceae bacterium]MCI0741483.1 hypothetical protein [Gemmataceae bacterium]
MRRIIVLGIAAALAGVFFAGSQEPVAAQGGQWGTIKGRIVWGGKDIPQPKEIEAIKNHADKNFCLKDGPVLTEEWVVDKKTKGLRWTFVWLTNQNPKNPLAIHPDLKSIKDKEVVMDQPICMFLPHAIALREGQILVAKNSATIAHNFKWTGNPTTANAGNNVLIAPGGDFKIKGLVADRLPVKIECNIHPWMNGWVRIFDHPYFAVTDANGNFEIKNAPAGSYHLVVWHGSGGWRGGAKGKTGESVNVKAGGVTDVGSLDYPPPAN